MDAMAKQHGLEEAMSQTSLYYKEFAQAGIRSDNLRRSVTLQVTGMLVRHNMTGSCHG